MSASVQSLISYGLSGLVVDIECHLSNNLPNIVIVGFANKSVDEARERVRSAFGSSGLDLPRKRITINLAPADIPKDGSSFDLAIAAAIMQATAGAPGSKRRPPGIHFQPLGPAEAVMGELGLDGSIRPVRGIIGKILAGRSNGITKFYIPASNLQQALLVPDVILVPLVDLKQLHGCLYGLVEPTSIPTGSGSSTKVPAASQSSRGGDHYQPEPTRQADTVGLSDVIGQQQAKRALEIAAAGGHNLLLNGPPGTGKSMLARALPSILPDLNREEMLEVTHLHSLASKQYDQIITQRPFRAPHHSASQIAILGGGAILRPGEISLSHRGVLFFDEFPEFNRSTIEALRQPLEDHIITVARARDSLAYPADFIMIATANPCPCGYYGASLATRQCDCAPAAIQRYRSKLSGPIMDRIDLYADVHEVDYSNLIKTAMTRSKASQHDTQDNEKVRRRVTAARKTQAKRYGGPNLNASMTNRDITAHAHINAHAKSLLDTAGRSLELSARAYMRTIKVARTIADLDASKTIETPHVTEALQYRCRV